MTLTSHAIALISRRIAVPLVADVIDDIGLVIGQATYIADSLIAGQPRYEMDGAMYALDWRGGLTLVQEERKVV